VGKRINAPWWAALSAALMVTNAQAQQVIQSQTASTVQGPAPQTASQTALLKIEVFTHSTTLLTNTAGAQIYLLDGLKMLELELSQGLSSDAQASAQIAQERIVRMGPALQKRAANAAQAITLAKQYGIERVPAVVFGGQTVVYGVSDVAQAAALFSQQRRAPAP
jgi:integrating conjugative element protein (TIGR03757 family)